ncbi:MAG: hypothetical protein U9P10_06050 [Thermodesulfobacteriota bacterium]|nr:hypothetical protein [Thermodesulfobacteriota bacterium]
MKKISRFSVFLLFITFLAINGCATNRGVVNLKIPESVNTAEPNDKTIYIESVFDKRIFQNNPKTQDIPSLGFGGSEVATSDIKKRAIARKRNGFGKAMGDILLQKGQTVETVIENSLKQAFIETGYEVLNNKEKISRNTLIKGVEIDQPFLNKISRLPP